jgi:hypothetical protein
MDEWAPATLNYPITTGDRLWTGREARAELHVGATSIHLAPETAFAVLNLDDRSMQMSISQGTVYLRVPRLDDDAIVEVDTPDGAMSILAAGDYRVDVDAERNATRVIVRSGRAETSANGRVVAVAAGESLELGPDSDLAVARNAESPDPWEDWCVGRDRLAERSTEVSENYVTPEMDGVEDLGQNGVWTTDETYGAVWAPRGVPGDWAPYRFGHWAYIPPWGWTWIDDAPWGFAPFHYGRWIRAALGWVWVPGPRAIRPVYAPALVVFVNGRALAPGGPRAGHVAWIPLGPREAYRPNYPVTAAYLRRVNRNTVANPDGTRATYANRSQVTAVPHDVFAGARPVAAGAVRIPPGSLANVQAVNVDASPSRESYLGPRSRSGAKASVPPADRAVVVRHELPPTVRPPVPVRGAAQAPAGRAPVYERPRGTEAREVRPPESTPAPAAPPVYERPQAPEPRGARPPATTPTPAAPPAYERPRPTEPRLPESPRQAAPPAYERPRAAEPREVRTPPAAPPPPRQEVRAPAPAPPPPPPRQEARPSAPPERQAPAADKKDDKKK